MFESEEAKAERARMNAILRREEYLTIVMTLTESLIAKGKEDPVEGAIALARDLTSHLEDVHPLPE